MYAMYTYTQTHTNTVKLVHQERRSHFHENHQLQCSLRDRHKSNIEWASVVELLHQFFPPFSQMQTHAPRAKPHKYNGCVYCAVSRRAHSGIYTHSTGKCVMAELVFRQSKAHRNLQHVAFCTSTKKNAHRLTHTVNVTFVSRLVKKMVN